MQLLARRELSLYDRVWGKPNSFIGRIVMGRLIHADKSRLRKAVLADSVAQVMQGARSDRAPRSTRITPRLLAASGAVLLGSALVAMPSGRGLGQAAGLGEIVGTGSAVRRRDLESNRRNGQVT